MNEKDAYSELSSIRNLMERSTKFISLSGLSGVLAGIYALTGFFFAYRIVYRQGSGLLLRDQYVNDPSIWWPLILIAVIVLLLSLLTGVWLTIRTAKKKKENYWNESSRQMLRSMIVPLVAGGSFMCILVFRGEYAAIASASLIFYGLSLVAGSFYTVSDVKWLGYLEIILGLIAAATPGYGLICWVLGFGILHIIYGSIMHFKYDQ